MGLDVLFRKYFSNVDLEGEIFFDNIWIKSNHYYIFFLEDSLMGKTIALFSKKYYLTIELSRNKTKQNILNRIGEVVDRFREAEGLKVEKYSFWFPHCIVKGGIIETKKVAQSYGVSRELALDYLYHYDKAFAILYNPDTKLYMGMPLLPTCEEAESYTVKDNTREYYKALKALKKAELA